jgi:hypothetical protein
MLAMPKDAGTFVGSQPVELQNIDIEEEAIS